MKTILLLATIGLSHFGFGQINDTIPINEYFSVIADSKTYHFTQTKASFNDSSLFIQGSKPNQQNMYPIFQLFVQTDGQPMEYDSKKNSKTIYGTFRKGGQEVYYSQSHAGSCLLHLQELTSSHVKGSFSMTAFSQYGSSAMLLTGSFYLRFKKD